MAQQFGETPLRRDTCTLPELVAFIQNAGVFWIGRLSTIEGCDRSVGIPAHVEERDAQVAVDGGKGRIERCSALPKFHRLIVAPTIVEQVAEIIRRARIVWDGLGHSLQDQHLFEAMREAIIGRACGSDPPCLIALALASYAVQQIAERVVQKRNAAVDTSR